MELDAAFDEHTTEKATLDGIKETADELAVTTDAAWDAAVLAKSEEEARRDEDCTDDDETAGDNCTHGETELLRLATVDSDAADDALPDLESDEQGTFDTYKGHKKTNDKHTKKIEIYNMACDYTDNNNTPDDAGDDTVYDCDGYDNDPVKVLLAALASDTAGYADAVSDAEGLWHADVTEVATAKVTQAEK